MKNLTIKIDTEDMTQLRIEVSKKELTSCEYAFILYQLLLQLYKRDKEDVLIAIDTFMDALLEERGEQ